MSSITNSIYLIVIVSVLVPVVITAVIVFAVVKMRKNMGGPTVVDLSSGTTTTYHQGGITVRQGGQTFTITTAPAVAATAPITDAVAPTVPPAQQLLAPILAHDPDLRAEKLYTTAEACFHDFWSNWVAIDPEPMRWRLDDGIYEAYAAQIEQYRKDHRRNRLDNLHLQRMDLIQADHTHELDSVTFRLQWKMADYDVDAATGEVVRGDDKVEFHAEDWTFTRDGQAVTVPEVRTNQCNQCGGPLQKGQRGACSFCGANIVGARDEWVLSRIYRHR